MKKLFLFCLLVLCLANTAFSATVSVNYDRLTYTVDTTKKTAECAGPQNTAFEYVDLVIPDYIPYNGEYYPVVSIANWAFYDEDLKASGSLTIGNNVKTIGNYAFDEYPAKGSLTLGQSVEVIGDNAFSWSDLKGSLVIPNSVKTIGEGAFDLCNGFTGTLIIGDSVEDIYSGAFSNCNFTSVYIGKSVKNIGKNMDGRVFKNCNNIQTVICAPNTAPTMDSRNYMNFETQVKNNAKLYLANSSISSYKNAYEWKDFKSITTIDANATSLSIDKTSLSLKLNESDVICATATPYYTWDEVSWSVDPTGIVSIENDHNELSEAGALTYLKVTGKQGGKATITATCGNYTATCEVEVNVPVSGISLNKTSLSMTVGDSETLTATLQPEGASGDVVWSVTATPEGCVTVDNGKVTALSPGNAKVTASCGSFSANCDVEVKEKTQQGGGQLPGGGWNYEEGDENAQVFKRIYMEIDGDKDLSEYVSGISVSSWTCSDEGMLETTRRGIVYAYEFGEAVVRAKDASGATVAVFEVFVCPTVSVEHGGIVYTHHVIYNSMPTISLNPGAGYKIAGVTHDGVEISDKLISNDGQYTPAEPIKANSLINLTLEQDPGSGPTTGIGSVLSDSDVRIYVSGRHIRIAGASENAEVTMTNLEGKILFKENYHEFYVLEGGVYLLTVDGRTYKILVS